VTLKSNNPFDAPNIDLGYLSHPFDIQAIREGARILRRFFVGPAWSDYIAAPLTIGPEEAGFDDQVRTWILSTWHPVGTAAMSARGSRMGVLDPDLRVKGVKGLRVVDASAFVSVMLTDLVSPLLSSLFVAHYPQWTYTGWSLHSG
jgi:choline dehydrogenase